MSDHIRSNSPAPLRGDPDALLEQASAQIASSEPAQEQARAAAARVWDRLASDSTDVAAQAAEIDEIRGCDDYQALIPAYLEDALPEARKLLLEDHTRECVPCRRALKTAREGEAPAKTWQPAEEAPAPGWRSYKVWAIAAALIAGIGVAQFLVRELMPFGSGTSAMVQTVDGDLFRIAATSQLPIAEGAAVREGETIRTGRDGSAVVKLNDGSLIEIRQRSEVRLEETRRGTTVELERGSVIVQAADQRQRHLYVATEDCLVSVTGTIFSVNHGTKGSRVAVIEGEVKVAHSGEETVLEPGQQVATNVNLGDVMVADEIAWSRDVDHYLTLLGEYSQLRKDLRQSVPRPGLRYDSRLLDLAPESTVFYAALPNLGETISETHRLIQERLDDNQMLADWWNSQGAQQFAPDVDEIVGKLSDFGDYLGAELAVIGYTTALGEFDGPLVLAEVVDPAGLQDFIEQQIGQYSDGDHGELVFVEDPFAPQGGEDRLLLWLAEGLAVAATDAAQIARVAGIVLQGADNPFTDTELYAAIAALYQDGTDVVVAADLKGVMTTQMAGDTEGKAEQFERMGFLDAKHLLLESKQLGTKTHHRASLTFSEARSGLASWLASPAPMGALDFVSPDAQMVAAFVFKDPVKLLDDLYAMMESEGNLGELSEFEQRHGFSLRDDVAASLGGEFAVALDGPILPEPSWKVVLEVYDPAKLQWTLEEALAELNTHLGQEGEAEIELRQEEVGGQVFYTVDSKMMDVHYTFEDGYMVLAPNRTLLDRAIRFRDSGYSITDASRFTSLLPADGRNNFSGLIYQDLSSVMSSVAERIAQGQLSEEQKSTLEAMKTESAPSLGYAYGEEDSILIAASSDNDALSSVLLYMLGMKNPAGLEQVFKGL